MTSSSLELQELPNERRDEVQFQNNSPPETAVTAIEKWNSSWTNIFRLGATAWGFLVMGGNDAAYGAIIPYLEEYYDLSYLVVSLVFFSPLGGYAAAAFLNNVIHMRLGQRGVAFIGPLCHIIAFVGISQHPKYPALIVFFLIAGFGNGIEDAAWNVWVGGLTNSNELLGMLHGTYGVGAVLSPLIATSLVTKAGWDWWTFYYFMIGGAVIEFGVLLSSFWSATGAKYRSSQAASSNKGSLKTALSFKTTWIAAIFLLGYVGVEVSLGGWVVKFMTSERGGKAFESGIVATGFWIGITVGRMVLGFITPRVGEKLAVSVYVAAALGFQLLFWLVPKFAVSATAVAFEGFFLGPLFPAVVVVTTKLLPANMHVSAVGFAAALGGGGAAIFPFAVGALAQAKGVSVLQPAIVGLLGALFVVWLLLPRNKDKKDDGTDVERSGAGVLQFCRKKMDSAVSHSRGAFGKLHTAK
ncbi:uncharacterized protein K452DRAFT_292784 [Aplosporella prunicola CBS 121167]|uniref:Major facilitator superfamily (MFS) profile domain-containing protein n=1 Tax=Aplosporella prunicola CBS 121167 TaxID=1176127 RepID=A0A6A6AXU0_9PEZI|nr:uncharacterized protein K452DRAFT_292784 [Aplosporella prunicola CBS 121167]KAF2135983.1 hypothetical protein K452DRAFT_292784 [Aplosporella prunicola CBS 121167]